MNRLEVINKIFGPHKHMRGSELMWQCPFCYQAGKDSKSDNFSYNQDTGKYCCVAVSDHTKQISDLIRKELYQTGDFGSRKMKRVKTVPVEEMPQEIVDYWKERHISVEALTHFGVKYDPDNVQMVIPTQLFKDKYKPLFHVDKGKWSTTNKIGTNTLYPVDKQYKGQKKFLYLEGLPDIWSIKSAFPEEFFTEWYVSGTVHGASHIPEQWKEPKYWENFDEVFICPDHDEAGLKGADKLLKLIGSKAKIVDLPYKHKRIVGEVEVNYPSKDFNDWIVEGGDVNQFLSLLNKDGEYEQLIDKAAMDFLMDPKLLEKYLHECEVIGYIGETDNKIQLYLENCSRLSRERNGGISSKGQAPTAVGKTTLYKMIGQHFFKEDFIILTDRSPKAMLRKKRDEYKHKIVMTEENYKSKQSSESEDKEYQMRIAKSEGILTYDVLVPDKDEGHTSKIVELEGPFVFQEATTKFEFKDEDINRDMVHHFDESSAQTAAIVMGQKKYKANYDPVLRAQMQFIIDKHIRVQKILKANIPDVILVPFAEMIEFPVHLHRARRDFPRLLRYIEVCAFLHQFQRTMMSSKEYLGAHSSWKTTLSGVVKECEEVKPSETDSNQVKPGVSFTCIDALESQILGNHADLANVSQQVKPELGGVIYHLKKQLENDKKILMASVEDYEICSKYIIDSFSKEYVNIDTALARRFDTLERELGTLDTFTVKRAAEILGCSPQFARKTLKALGEAELCEIDETNRVHKYRLLAKQVIMDNFNLISLNQEKESLSPDSLEE